jgi:dihydrodipicolinate synthase/N-acetylneuraminate lyase
MISLPSISVFSNFTPILISNLNFQLRQEIWAKYRSGNNKYQAFLNVRKKFDSVSPSKITFWYKRFGEREKTLTRVIKISQADKR